MKKVFALLLTLSMIIALAACSGSGSGSKTEAGSKAAETTQAEATAEETTKAAALDVSALKWVKGELDCYGYKYKNEPCYMSYQVPESFKTGTEDSSGLQYRGYFYNPSDPDAKANSAPYGVYIYFNQGSYGAKRDTLEADISGGFKERELGGRTVLFGECTELDQNTGSHVFDYYVKYDDDEYSRIWFVLCDTEADGEFRKTFEQSISFTK